MPQFAERRTACYKTRPMSLSRTHGLNRIAREGASPRAQLDYYWYWRFS
jgi:hypothetical protein